METTTINGTKYGVEKLKATEGFKLQLKVVKILGNGIFDGLKSVDNKDLKDIKKMDTTKLFDALGKFIATTDDEEVYDFVIKLLSKNVYVIGKADGDEVKIPLDIDTHMDDRLIDIFKLAIFVLKVNLGKSIASFKSISHFLEAK